jgi:hypothetical protein
MDVNPADKTGLNKELYDEIKRRMGSWSILQWPITVVVLGGAARAALSVGGDFAGWNSRTILAAITFPFIVATGFWLQLVILRALQAHVNEAEYPIYNAAARELFTSYKTHSLRFAMILDETVAGDVMKDLHTKLWPERANALESELIAELIGRRRDRRSFEKAVHDSD